ncbi:hypothetical protein SAMN05421788_1011477 [Filimonas lacunae]|uniref:Uncharacterized protein n=1 Tax=Filimonas lacunae TaxID=477680 RepID=A0A1N7MAQ1_9BACT|nr:hypothetical protein SAMN05421788_1011477 [Filimonas lacunae]
MPRKLAAHSYKFAGNNYKFSAQNLKSLSRIGQPIGVILRFAHGSKQLSKQHL